MPGALAAVVFATLVTLEFHLPVATVEVRGLLDSVSLFSAAAVDRMHEGPRTSYDKELMAQGVGNAVCGALGALPINVVIVRSAASAQSGAKTKTSRVLHSVWLLLFVALLPFALAMIPLPALAGVLVHAGWKLIPFRQVVSLWRDTVESRHGEHVRGCADRSGPVDRQDRHMPAVRPWRTGLSDTERSVPSRSRCWQVPSDAGLLKRHVQRGPAP